MKTLKIGMSGCGSVVDPADFIQMRKAGIEVFESSFQGDTNEDRSYWENLAKGAKEAGVTIWSVHLPFSPVDNPANLEEDVRKTAMARYKNIMDISTVTGACVYVIHASSEPIAEEDRAASMEYAKVFLKELAAYAEEKGVKLAVEDLPRTCLGADSNEVKELISVHPNLYVCFDTNHLLFQDNIEFVKELGDKIITLHVSDYDFIDERHFLPGVGKVDWNALMDALEDIGYEGPLMYELAWAQKEPEKIRVTPEMLVQNAKELMARAKLTPPTQM